jgi:hypothetical protein
MSTQSDLRTISSLLGDALSQFAKLFQNEVDLAKAELGEKVQQVGGGVVAANLLSCLRGRCSGACRPAFCGRHQPAGRAQPGAP